MATGVRSVSSRYRLLEKIGEDGRTGTWRGTDLTLGRTVVLKFLTGISAGDRGEAERFLDAARRAAALDHPNVCTIYHAGRLVEALKGPADETLERGTPFVAMEFVTGTTLQAISDERGALPLSELLPIAARVADGVAAAHARGVTHGCLSPGKVVLTPGGTVKILDLGLGNADADAANDIHAVGALIRAMGGGNAPSDLTRELLPEVAAIVRGGDQLASGCVDAACVASELMRLTDEITASVVRKRRGISRVRRRPAGVRLRRWLVVLALAAVGTVVALVGLPRRAPDTGAPSRPVTSTIAVLPFVNVSDDDGDNDYLVTGIGAHLHHTLQNVGVPVTTRDTVYALAGMGLDMPQLANRLGAGALLRGEVQITDDGRLRTRLRLLDGQTGLEDWSFEVESAIDGQLEHQRDVATKAAAKIKPVLTAEDERALRLLPSNDAAAYDLYLYGSALLSSQDPEAVSLAADYFEQALELDEELAMAHVGLGAALTRQSFMGHISTARDWERAERHFLQANQLDGSLDEARRGLLRIYWQQGRTRECLELAREASLLGTSTDVDSLLTQGDGYLFGGLPDVAVERYMQVIRLEPLNRAAHWQRVIALSWSGRHREAIEAGSTFTRLYGPDPEIEMRIGVAHQDLGEYSEALERYERASQRFGNVRSLMVWTFQVRTLDALGRADDARDLANRGREAAAALVNASPDHPLGLLYLAGFEALLQNRQAVDAIAQRLTASGLEAPAHRRGLAVMYHLLGDGERSVEHLWAMLGAGDVSRQWERFFGLIAGEVPSNEPYLAFIEAFEAERAKLRRLYVPVAEPERS